MKSFGYPKEDRGDKPWSDRPMRIVDGVFFWGEDDGYWWSEDGEEFKDDLDQTKKAAPLPKE